jgi:hypothetical protein
MTDSRPTKAALLSLLAGALALPAQQTDPKAQPRELGAVEWWRDESAAQRAAASSGRPILALFQEVPG